MAILDSLIAVLRPIPFRKFRLLNPLVPTRGFRRAKIFGASMELDLADIIQRQIYLGCYEPDCTRWAKRALRPGGVMIDVGANVGYFTALAAARVGLAGRVFAIEP